MGAPPVAAAPAADDGLAASPWNTANNPGFNRDLLPSAMLAPPPEPPSSVKKAPAQAKPVAGEEPSRAPWIIVGVLVLVAIAGGVAVFQIRAHQGKDGQIAIPAGGATATADDTPAEPAPTATTSAVRAAPIVRPVFRPRPAVADDPYSDVPVRPSNPGRTASPASPSPTTPPTAAPHRIFGTEN